MYLHVPYCSSRCGYCDFNTYTAEELGPGASRSTYADALIAEIVLARRRLPDAPRVATVFVGGGTPTLLGARDLGRILDAVRGEFGLEPDAEVTTEANPDSVDAEGLERLREAGFTRISFGVQSLAPHVLAALDRTHTPGRSTSALREARAAGFDHVSADLIYATPGETDADLRASVEGVLAEGIDHLSAYSLIVEP
ncbi:MAG: coproporphyrinogen-III oxidase family protein, partial [Candidatus Nanopelagicales bacterium]